MVAVGALLRDSRDREGNRPGMEMGLAVGSGEAGVGPGSSAGPSNSYMLGQRQTQAHYPPRYVVPDWMPAKVERRERGVEINSRLKDWIGKQFDTEAQAHLEVPGRLPGPMLFCTLTYRRTARMRSYNDTPVLTPSGEPVYRIVTDYEEVWKDGRRFLNKLSKFAYGTHPERYGMGVDAFMCVEPHVLEHALHLHLALAGLSTFHHPEGVRYPDIGKCWRHGWSDIAKAKNQSKVVGYVAKHVIGYVASGHFGKSGWDLFGPSVA